MLFMFEEQCKQSALEMSTAYPCLEYQIRVIQVYDHYLLLDTSIKYISHRVLCFFADNADTT